MNAFNLGEFGFAGAGRQQHQARAIAFMMNTGDPLAIRRKRGTIAVSELYRGRTICPSQINGGIAALAIGELYKDDGLGVVRDLVDERRIQPTQVTQRSAVWRGIQN